MLVFFGKIRPVILTMLVCALMSVAHAQDLSQVTVTRLLDEPIITPALDARMGSNIQGPSLIRAPEWIENPLGAYYLYFSDHKGEYIRLAYADTLTGPWTVYSPGTLQLSQSYFPETCPPCSVPEDSVVPAYAHIASPDVIVREDRRELLMYVHGREPMVQVTRLATSSNGIDFEGAPEILGRPYFRTFRYKDYWYGLAMPGFVYRSQDGYSAGFYPVFTDTSKKPHNGQKECLCQREESTVQSLKKVPLNRFASPVSVVPR